MQLQMNGYSIKTILLVCLLGIGGSSCNTTKKAACPPDIMCTMIFKSVSVKVTDAAGKAVKLDEAYTIHTKTKEVIRMEQHSDAGYYVVLDDSYRKKIQNTTADFRFIGKKSGVQVIDALYTIGADCCHISRQSGPDTVVVR